MTPRISVIVPHYNQPALLERCLEALLRQSIGRDAYEIIVADNGAAGGPGAFASQMPGVRFIHEPKRGAAHARNAGLATARGEIIAFTDADCVPAEDWLAAGAAALAHADLVGGPIDVFVADPARPTAIESFERVFAFRQRNYVEQKGFAATANLFATRAAALATGPFRHGVSEDVDWCRRARALGLRLAFNDTARVGHPARQTFEELAWKWERLIEERWNGLNGGALSRSARFAVLAAATAFSIAPHAVQIIASRAIDEAEKPAAFGTLARIRLWRAQRMMSIALGGLAPRAIADGVTR
jgi:glycosyltransferase involved in cell wall biosynthesis